MKNSELESQGKLPVSGNPFFLNSDALVAFGEYSQIHVHASSIRRSQSNRPAETIAWNKSTDRGMGPSSQSIPNPTRLGVIIVSSLPLFYLYIPYIYCRIIGTDASPCAMNVSSKVPLETAD